LWTNAQKWKTKAGTGSQWTRRRKETSLKMHHNLRQTYIILHTKELGFVLSKRKAMIFLPLYYLNIRIHFLL
jgi:hypothetical protein